MRRVGLALVRGRSMLPALHDGDRLLVVHGMRPAVGSLVVVRLPGLPLAVKRVVRRTPDGWWVERDNPAEGVDSWLLGAVRDEDVVAVVIGRLWPPRLYGRRSAPGAIRHDRDETRQDDERDK